MSKTVVIVSDDGRLIDVKGTLKEAAPGYAKFAKRLLCEEDAFTTLDYGWNGKTRLIVSASGGAGDQISLKAREVAISGSLKIGGVALDSIIAEDVDAAIDGIQGTEGEIDVRIVDNDVYGSGYLQPRKTCTISLSGEILNRIETLEAKLSGLIAFDRAYKVGDGLTTETSYGIRKLIVKTGTGLTFEEDIDGTDGTMALATDCDDYPSPASYKPISSSGVYNAIEDVYRYRIEVSSSTGNVVLYDTRS